MIQRSFAAKLAVAGLLLSPAAAQTYSFDDGSTENAFSFMGALAEHGFLMGFTTVGPTDVLGQIEVSIGTALAPANGLDGRMTRVAVWDDPNGDGDPSDAVLLFESAAFPATSTNLDQKMVVALSSPVAVSGGFFIGAIVEFVQGDFPVGIDNSTSGLSAYAFADDTAIDTANLASNSIDPVLQGSSVFLLSATGGANSSISTNYCGPSVPNSSGNSGSMSAAGSTAVSENNVTLMASGLPVGQFGIFVTSRMQGFSMGAGGTSNGNLCLGGTLGRFNAPGQILNSGGAGAFQLALDLTSIPEGGSFASVSAGESWNFQAWHRDGAGLGSNFTDGIEITFN